MQSRRNGWCRATVVLPRGRGQCGNTPSSNYTTPPTCGGHVLTGADGPRNALGMVATPPGNPWGVAVTMGVWLVPMGAGAARGRGVGVARRSRAFQDAGATSPANALGGCTPNSGLPTGMNVGFVGGTRKHAGAAS